MKKITTRLEMITPALAQEWLDTRAPNRPLRKVYSAELAASIIAGEWEPNGASIVFSDEGRMEDGQHRCLAVVLSGMAIETIVVRGVPVGSFDSLDIGRGRTTAHLLARDGEGNYSILASALRWLHMYQEKTFLPPTNKLSRPQMRDLLARNPKIRSHCSEIKGSVRGLIPTGMVGAFRYIAAEIDSELAVQYFADIMTGENIGRESWSFYVRSRLLASHAGTLKLAVRGKAELLTRSWNAMRSGRKPGAVKLFGCFVKMI